MQTKLSTFKWYNTSCNDCNCPPRTFVLVFTLQLLLRVCLEERRRGGSWGEDVWEGDDGGVFWRGRSHSSPLYGSLIEVTDWIYRWVQPAIHSAFLFPLTRFSILLLSISPRLSSSPSFIFDYSCILCASVLYHTFTCIKKHTKAKLPWSHELKNTHHIEIVVLTASTHTHAATAPFY